MSFRDSRYLENAISSAHDEARNLSEEGQSWLAQLMTVWASGYLEATCRDVLRTYAERHAHSSVAGFVSRNLDRFSSPKMENILTLVRSFDKNRAGELEEFAEGSVKESVNSIVGLRNQIAHGRPTNVSVALISRYFEDAKKFDRKLRTLFNTMEED